MTSKPTERRGMDDAWEGVMITYQEQDAPGAEPYPRTVPGWKCRACGMQYGTEGLPPLTCKCGATWDGARP